jgi:O-antigen ligase
MARRKSLAGYLLEFPLFFCLAAILIGGPLWLGAVDVNAFSVMGALAGFMLCWHGVLIAIRRTQRQLWIPPCFSAGLFVLFVCWRFGAADISYVARLEWLRVLCYGGIFIITIQQLHKQGWIHAILFTLILVGTGLSIMAMIQYITDSKMVWNQQLPQQYWGRASGSYICPNHLGGLLEMIAPVALSLGLTSRLSHSLRIGLVYCGLVMIAGLVVTFSRGAWFSLAVSLTLLLMFLLRRPNHRWAALAVFILVSAGIFVFASKNSEISQRIVEVADNEGNIENIRFVIWKAATAMWRDHAVLGVGPGHFDYLFPAYRPEEFQLRAGYAHNDYLNALTDYGVVGLLLVLLTPLILIWNFPAIWRGNRRDHTALTSKNSNKEPVLIGCGLGMLAMLIHSFVDFNMQIPANAAVFVVLLAIFSSQWRNATRRFWISPKLWMTAIQLPVFVGLGIYLGFQSWLLWSSQDVMKQARSAATGSQQIELLQTGHRIDPANWKFSTMLGEFFRSRSFEGNDNYQEDAEAAVHWFDRSIEANPWHYYAYLRAGLALDYIYQHEKAEDYFQKALAIDPNGYFTHSHLGWHYLNAGDYEKSLEFFQRSLELKPEDNEITERYLPVVKSRLNID